MRRALRAAAAAIPAATMLAGAGAEGAATQPVRLLGGDHVTVSPDGDGIDDVVRLRVTATPGAPLVVNAYRWGGRLVGWQPLETVAAGTVAGPTTLVWVPRNARGTPLADGSYVVTVCRLGARVTRPPPLPPNVRPGAAEHSVARPPWARRSCLAQPVVVSVRRLSLGIASTGSFVPGERVPLELGTDKSTVALMLELNGADVASPMLVRARPRLDYRLPRRLRPGLYHVVATDDRGNLAYAPLVVRNPEFDVTDPPKHTALLVYPFLTWRAYSLLDGNGDGRPDGWYQFWRQRAVTLAGPLLPGLEDDYPATRPFSLWLATHPSHSVEAVTDTEVESLSPKTLTRYAMLVFPGHTEYYTPALYDRVRDYRDHGGDLVFLQANPFYRQVRLDWRRNLMVMTDLDARGKRSDFALAGVGYDGCCFLATRAAPYVVTRSGFSRVAWLFAGTGIGPGAAFGRLQGELDRTDPELTPHDHVVAAEAIVRGRHGVIHAEMTYSRVAGGGSVFAAASTHFLRIPRRSPGGTPVPLVMLDNLWKKDVGGR